MNSTDYSRPAVGTDTTLLLDETLPDSESDETQEHLQLNLGLSGLRLDAALAKCLPQHSRVRLQQWIAEGRVSLDGVAVSAKAGRSAVRGDEAVIIRVPVAAPAISNIAEPMAFDVVYEDADIIVVDKPAGLVVHPGNGHASGTLLNGLLWRFPELAALPRAGIVHRLDRETSGLMVVARTEAAQNSLVRQLSSRSVKREYAAVVYGTPKPSGTIDAMMGRHPMDRTRMAVLIGEGGKEAITHFEVVERFVDCALLRCKLETGRTHQIRVHMEHLGFPLVGDPVYGRRRLPKRARLKIDFPRQALHAAKLGLLHPTTGEHMEWKSRLPEDFRELLRLLREELDDKREQDAENDDDDHEMEIIWTRE